ncbi:MAG: SGNH/GDSL hydrolase family protein [Bacteroidetes bacterium]|nr:MAG: SGNH/GDSL hydrolase family protein [Bacteroidota bacterium]
MIRHIKQIGLYALLITSATACYVDPTVVTPTTPVTPITPSAGTASFTKYVAIGNSLTAGFADGGLYRSGQLMAYPNLLANQFKLVGGGAFDQPLFSEAQKDGSGYLVLRNNPLTGAAPVIQPFGPSSTGFAGAIIGLGANGTTPLYAKHTGANSNFGVPGIRIADVNVAGYGFNNPAGFNPYFERLLGTADALSTYKNYVVANSTGATFFSMWLGNNDVLGYATSGGMTPLTQYTTFTAEYKSMLDAIKAIATKGVLISIPQVTTAAYFRTITRTSLLTAVQQVNPTVKDIFIASLIGVRPASDNDLFLLGAQADYANIGRTNFGSGQPFPYGLHPNNPLVGSSVLDMQETSVASTMTDLFNAYIKSEADANGLAFLDVNAMGGALQSASSSAGFTVNSIRYTNGFISGGVFSLDGIHLTPAGNAIITNEILRAINAKYTATIPLINILPSIYRGVVVTPAP